MKKFSLIIPISLLLILLFSTTVFALEWTPKQIKAHEIAEMARQIGLSEDDPIIIRAQEIWWEEQNLSYSYLGTYHITGYDPFCSHCCGKNNGITASGVKAIIGETAAASNLNFGTRIYIKNLGYYTIHDRGVKKGVIDIACSNHEECYSITGDYEVYILK